MRFLVLDLLRWVLAMLVAAMHLGGWAAPHKAYLAVDFFFILSGFVLTGAYLAKATGEGFARRFIVDRIARLYPLHLATLLLLVAMNLLFWTGAGTHLEAGWSYGDGVAYTFLLNLLLLQNVGLTTDSSWNAPSWSISVEFFVNVALGFVLLRLAARKATLPWLLAVSIAAYIVLFNTFGHLGVFTETAYGVFNSGIVRGVAGIGLGAVGWYCFLHLKKRTVGWVAPAGAVGSTVTFLVLILLATETSNIDFLVLPLMFAAVVLIALAEHQRPIGEGLIGKLILALGASSYAVYLCHWPIITFIRYQLIYAWGVSIDITSPGVTIAILALIAVVAIPVYYLFEYPAKKQVKAWLTKSTS